MSLILTTPFTQDWSPFCSDQVERNYFNRLFHPAAMPRVPKHSANGINHVIEGGIVFECYKYTACSEAASISSKRDIGYFMAGR